MTEHDDPTLAPLVLTQNEATVGGKYDHWEDETGARYHYPNGYRNRIRPGRPFIYYRGALRASGAKGQPEYFGFGAIGEVWPDPKQDEDTPAKDRRWYCSIEDYTPFPDPIAARHDDGAYLEEVVHSNHWGTAVREISPAVYDRVLALAGFAGDRLGEPAAVATEVADPPMLVDVETLMPPRPPRGNGNGGPGSYGPQRSRNPKWVGDRAEEAVRDWLAQNLDPTLVDSITWHAKQGETPGYDLSYRNEAGQLIGVEVKGTVGRGWHSLRRKFASDLKHVPLKTLCELGGWKTHETLLTCYQQTDEGEMRGALESRRTGTNGPN